jgi:hypothetical protein
VIAQGVRALNRRPIDLPVGDASFRCLVREHVIELIDRLFPRREVGWLLLIVEAEA